MLLISMADRCQQQVPGTTNLFSINMDNGYVNNGFELMECHDDCSLVINPIEDWNTLQIQIGIACTVDLKKYRY
ncbi:unnamed protein product [Callosobruchus maculatus]|uniref:Uncharacterized protein n=1 Tax=Callosobruchus maculatus TaxID=64391 RepID=A0A653BFZ4_CALMS|nr:unnamed protein product [Callosobruchus maculatus]